MRRSRSGESGFSYIEVMVALVILLVGVLGMLSALTANFLRGIEAEKRIAAKQIALSTLESITAAKQIKRPGVIDSWDSLRNEITGLPPGYVNGIFVNGYRPIRQELGWDGVAGTVDDACPGPGGCFVSGRPPNTSPIIEGFEREIVITDVADPDRPPPNPISRRQITVNVRFFVNQLARTESVSTIITNY
jgi:type II secretory pathway pseudopilin PulG